MKFDINKFRFVETFNNSNGKTSGSGFIGVIGSLVSMFCLIIVIIGYLIGLQNTTEILTSLTLIIGIYTGLLMTRKIVGGKDTTEENKG